MLDNSLNLIISENNKKPIYTVCSSFRNNFDLSYTTKLSLIFILNVNIFEKIKKITLLLVLNYNTHVYHPLITMVKLTRKVAA